VAPSPESDPPPFRLQIPPSWTLAAWVYLLLTLATGVILRYQWTGHASVPVDARHLLHAHSHIALLGWAFVALFGSLLARIGAGLSAAVRWPLEVGVHLLILALFVAFLLQGYAFWSILLSMVHVGAGFGLVAAYGWRGREGIPPPARRWIDLSLLWFVLATLGPWMLALAGRMGDGWVDAWVGYYLTLLLQGWLAFGVVGLLVAVGRLRGPWWACTLMAVGVVPSALPRMTGILPGEGVMWAGWGGSLLYGAGLAMVAVLLGTRAGRRRWRGEGGAADPPGTGRAWTWPWHPPESLLGFSVGVAALLTAVFLASGSFPPLASEVMGRRNLVVGFVHLHLLAFVSPAFILLCLRPRGGWGTALFLAGAWAMILSLLGAGILSLGGSVVLWPSQWMLTWAGGVTLAGALLLRPRMEFRPRGAPASSLGKGGREGPGLR
jgi:hypothetical protein